MIVVEVIERVSWIEQEAASGAAIIAQRMAAGFQASGGRAQLAAAMRARRAASDEALVARTMVFARGMVRVGEHDDLMTAVKDASKYSLRGVGGARAKRLRVKLLVEVAQGWVLDWRKAA